MVETNDFPGRMTNRFIIRANTITRKTRTINTILLFTWIQWKKENNGNYEPSNCNFVTRIENLRNQRRVKLNLEKANEIRGLDKISKYTRKELAIKYNVGLRQIYAIINNKKWVNS